MRKRKPASRIMALLLCLTLFTGYFPNTQVVKADPTNGLTTNDVLIYGTVSQARFSINDHYDSNAAYVVNIESKTGDADSYSAAGGGISGVIETDPSNSSYANITITSTAASLAGDYRFWVSCNGEPDSYDEAAAETGIRGVFEIKKKTFQAQLSTFTKTCLETVTSDDFKSHVTLVKTQGSASDAPVPDIIYSSAGFAAGAVAGDYNVACAYDTDNYTIEWSETPKISVQKMDLADLAFTAKNVTYRLQGYEPADVADSWKAGNTDITDEVNSAVDYSCTQTIKNTGSYTLTATARDNSGYFTSTASAAFTVSPKPLTDPSVTVTMSEETTTFNKGSQTPVISVKDAYEVLVQDTDYTVMGIPQSGAGIYPVSIQGTGNYSGTRNDFGSFTINKATIPASVRVSLQSEWEYGDSVEMPSFEGYSTQDFPGTAVSFTFSGTTDAGQDLTDVVWDENTDMSKCPAGSYTLTAFIDGGNDYEDKTYTGTPFTVKPRNVVVVLKDIEIDYGQKVTEAHMGWSVNPWDGNMADDAYIYDAADPGIVEGDSPVFTGLEKSHMETVPSYKDGKVCLKDEYKNGIAALSTDKNYQLKKIVDGTFTINPVPVDDQRVVISLSKEGSRIYNGLDQKTQVQVAFAGGVIEDDSIAALSADDYSVSYYVQKQADEEDAVDPDILGSDTQEGAEALKKLTSVSRTVDTGYYYFRVSANPTGKLGGEKWFAYRIVKDTLTVSYKGISKKIYDPDDASVSLKGAEVCAYISNGEEFILTDAQKAVFTDSSMIHAFIKDDAYLTGDGIPVSFELTQDGKSALSDLLVNYEIVFALSDKDGGINIADVEKAPVTLSAEIPNWVYEDLPAEPVITVYYQTPAQGRTLEGAFSYSYACRQGDEEWREDLTWEDIQKLDAGTYSLRISLKEHAFYEPYEKLATTFTVYKKHLLIKAADTEKTYLSRDTFSYQVFEKQLDRETGELTGETVLIEDGMKYASLMKNGISLTRKKNADGSVPAEAVGVFDIEITTQLKDEHIANYDIGLENGVLTVLPLDLEKRAEDLVLQVQDAASVYHIEDAEDGKTQDVYLYSGRAHKPQMVIRKMQYSWNNSNEITAILGYKTEGQDGSVHEVRIPESDYIISFTDERGNQVHNPTDPGVYFITISASNGTENVVGVEQYYRFEILPVTYYITYDSSQVLSKTYDGTPDFEGLSVTGVSVGNKLIDENTRDIGRDDPAWPGDLPAVARAESANAGEYDSLIVDFSNLELPRGYAIVTDGAPKAVILPKHLDEHMITVSPQVFTYDKTAHLANVKVSDMAVINGVKTQLIGDGDYHVVFQNDVINAGQVMLAVYGYGNYTGTVTDYYLIRERNATLTVLGSEKICGDSDPVSFSYKVEGLAEGDVLPDIITYREEGEDAGQYLIEAYFDPALIPNYNITVKNGIFTIHKAPQDAPDLMDFLVTKAVTKNKKNGMISGFDESMQYSLDEGRTWLDIGKKVTELKKLAPGTVLVRYKEDENCLVSDPLKITVGAYKPSEPVFHLLALRCTQTGNNTAKLKWNKVAGAKKYVVYGSLCGEKIQKLAVVKKKTYNVTGLEKGGYYKFYVAAYDGDDNKLAKSAHIHVITGGGETGNPAKLTTKAVNDEISLEEDDTFSLKAAQAGARDDIKITQHRAVKYESTDTDIATVSSKGVVRGKKTGSCFVYVYAQNGLFKKIKVMVEASE